MDIDAGGLLFQLKDQGLFKQQCFINGEWVDSESKKTFETLNPENNVITDKYCRTNYQRCN